MQAILLAIACMYFVLGSTLEYIKNSRYIVTGLCIMTGIMKAYVNLNDLFILLQIGITFIALNFQDQNEYTDVEEIELHEGVAGILVTFKFSLTTIFIIALAKWFSRMHLPLIFVIKFPYLLLVQGLWFTNEAVSMFININFRSDEYWYILSGVGMVILSVVMFKHYTIDPIDSELLINEQAINMTSQFTNEVREEILLDDFLDEVR